MQLVISVACFVHLPVVLWNVFFRLFAGTFINVFFLSILSSLAESISIAMLIPFISIFINPNSYFFNSIFKIFFNFLNITDKKDILAVVSFSFIFIVLLSGFIKLKYLKFSNQLTENITSDFRIKIFNFLINQDYSYYFKYGSNEIMSTLAQKTNSFTAIIFSTLNILNSILIFTGIIIILVIVIIGFLIISLYLIFKIFL